MPLDYGRVPLYHITEIANLSGILNDGCLWSDANVASKPHAVIGYDHIKQRRLREIRVPCVGNRFVGEFVPFYYCARSPMLYTVNRGQTGKPTGHQKEIVHLVSTVTAACREGRAWAISDGNASAHGVSFFDALTALDGLDWNAIKARIWTGKTRQKCAEFLVADRFDIAAISHIGCHSVAARQRVNAILAAHGVTHITTSVEPSWYY